MPCSGFIQSVADRVLPAASIPSAAHYHIFNEPSVASGSNPAYSPLAAIFARSLHRPATLPNTHARSYIRTPCNAHYHRILAASGYWCTRGNNLIPEHLAFIIYANTRGDFVLGGLQALFENDLDRALHAVVEGERRCALDPGCREVGSACMACMHVGEPSCRYYNRSLTREALFGPNGYLIRRTPVSP